MRTRRTHNAQVVVGLAALMVLATSVSVAVVRSTRDEPASAEALLAKARVFVADHQTVTFRGESRGESTSGGFLAGEDVPPEQATTVVTRALIEGVTSGSDRSRSVTRSDGSVREAIFIGDQVWSRFAESDRELPDQKWTEIDLGSGRFEDGPGVGRLGGPGELTTSADIRDLASLSRLIDRAVSPTIVSRSGGETVVRAGIYPVRGALSSPVAVDRGSFELTLVDGGEPVRSVTEGTLVLVDEALEGSGIDPRVEFRTEYEYSGWADPVDISSPAEADIERTPGVDEEAVAAFRDAPLYQPRGIPEGWMLNYALVVAAEDAGSGCDQVEIAYTDPHDEYNGYLYLYEMSLDCGDLTPPPDSEPFSAGPNRGWVESYDEQYVYAQLVVGGTVIDVDSDLPPDSLARVLGQLRSLDLTVEPEAIAGLRAFGTPS